MTWPLAEGWPLPDRSSELQALIDQAMADFEERFPHLREPPGPSNPMQQTVPEDETVLRGSVVCLATEGLLGVMLALLGFGSPNTGGHFLSSGSMLDDVSAQIAALVPDSGWQGSAAQAYVAHNHAQSQHAKTMAALDRLTGDLIAAQARTVLTARRIVIVAAGVVAATGLCCLALETLGGPAGQGQSLILAKVVCGIALAVLAGAVVNLIVTTFQNAGKVQALTSELADIVTRLPELSDPIPGSPGAFSPRSGSASGFNATDHSGSLTLARVLDDTVTLPETPDVCLALADLPGSPEFSVPDLAGPGFPDFGAPDLTTPTLTGMPSVPDVFPGGLPAIPTADESAALPDVSGARAGLGPANLPTIAQLAAPLSALSGLSGATGGLSQLSNLAAQQAQMISSLAQQSAQQPATLADQVTQNDDTVGAAAGTPTAQRAPVDAATSPAPQRQLHAR
ncbi:hypothetical protein MKSMC1_49910 [Mycobacterium kansasii]|nr:hypothetical protein MKSMC1_49910 [Mycobacterium kansasii]